MNVKRLVVPAHRATEEAQYADDERHEVADRDQPRAGPRRRLSERAVDPQTPDNPQTEVQSRGDPGGTARSAGGKPDERERNTVGQQRAEVRRRPQRPERPRPPQLVREEASNTSLGHDVVDDVRNENHAKTEPA